MATIVNNPTPTERVVESDSSGWVVAVVVLLLVIAGGAYWWMHNQAAAPAPQGSNINITLPAGQAENPAPAAGGSASEQAPQ